MLSFSHTLCCEPLPEERSAGNPHATFCGNRWQATATDDPVGAGQPAFLPRPSFPLLTTQRRDMLVTVRGSGLYL